MLMIIMSLAAIILKIVVNFHVCCGGGGGILSTYFPFQLVAHASTEDSRALPQ